MKICLIASSGGHLEEINHININKKHEVYYVVTKTPNTIKDGKYKYLISDFNRKNPVCNFFRIIRMFYEQLKIFKKEKPDIIITTGAGLVIPTCFFAKIFRKKIIFFESLARINSMSKTGKILYHISDLFIVQNKELLKKYPKSIYGGWIF